MSQGWRCRKDSSRAVRKNVAYMCGPPIMPATNRFTNMAEVPMSSYRISGMTTSTPLPVR